MGTAVGATTIRETTEQAGQAQVQLQDKQVATLEASCPASPPGPEVQMMSVDGAFLQLVGGEWKEVKTLALGVVGKPVQEDGEQVVHTAELSYFSRMSESKEFERQALVEIHERGVEKAEVVCAVTDGAEWIQKFVELHRPDAVRMLDFAHAMEKVAEVGKTLEEQGLIFACLDENWEEKRAKHKPRCKRKKEEGAKGKPACKFAAQQAAESEQACQTKQQRAAQSKARLEGWLDWQEEQLKTGEVALVVQEIERLLLLVQKDGSGQAAQTLATCLNYLKAREVMMAYATFRDQGYPIGSGCVESANKLVVESRMKGSGMRWGEEHVNPMLALRNAACNDRWKPVWKQIRKQWVQQTQAKRAGKSAQRLLERQGQSEKALPSQTFTSELPSSKPLPPPACEPVGVLTKEAGLRCQPLEEPLSAQPSCSGQLKQETSPPKAKRPAPTHPWRRSFLRRLPAS